uniref:Proteasome subunit beta n=1 Tax=Glossina brevipalpis TaxID=37001 RepID=A0A1A9WGI2_9MUSC
MMMYKAGMKDFWGTNELPDEPFFGIKQTHFKTQEYNGGTIVALACNGFAIIAGDARLNRDKANYIHNHNQNKIFQLAGNCILGSAGCWTDVLTFTSLVENYTARFRRNHADMLSLGDIAKMLSFFMYPRRPSPYCITNLVAGLNEKGEGIVYSLGNQIYCQKWAYKATGSAGASVQKILDSRIGLTSLELDVPWEISEERAMDIITDAFTSVPERDTILGDSVTINTITETGITVSLLKLREDIY